jgi:hypothetical protein
MATNQQPCTINLDTNNKIVFSIYFFFIIILSIKVELHNNNYKKAVLPYIKKNYYNTCIYNKI